jgi:hypothetical protein
VLDGQEHDVVELGFPQVILDGFTVRNGRTAIDVSSNTARITNCIISENSSTGVFVGGAATIANCSISGNARGIDTLSATVTMDSCSISGNSITGVRANGSTTVNNSAISDNADGLSVHGNTVLTNCTVSGNTAVGVLVTGNNALGTATTITNCIVAFNQTGVRADQPNNKITLSHTDLYGNASTNYVNISNPVGKNGNISKDPLFVNRTSNDYHLLLGSPCIDSGDDLVVIPNQTDLDGLPRIHGSHVDIGAYEFVGVSYTYADAAYALRIAAGLDAAPSDISRWNVLTSTPGIDLLDVVGIMRKAAGLDAS